MPDIDELFQDGFRMDSLERGLSSLALISLKAALKAYFSTYRSMSYHLSDLKRGDSDLGHYQYSSEYIEHYSETIIHFQHFFELVCKDILRKENELLVLNIDRKHEILFDLIKGNEVSGEELEKINTMEFDRTFKRLCTLVSKEKLDSKYAFFNEANNRNALEKLNVMRNRVWHRGSYVIKYKSLDLFIGRYIFPIMQEVINLHEYSSLKRFWEYREIESNIEPISEIIEECKKNNPSLDKLAFLKELGRAAYENPLTSPFKFFRDEIIERSRRIALNELPHQSSENDYIEQCPVCGTTSLIKYEDSDGDQNEYGEYTSYWTWVYNIKCYCCTFELYFSGMENPKEYGYSLPDYWHSYEH